MVEPRYLILVACWIIFQMASENLAPAAELDDPFTGAIEVFRFSFENNQDLDYDRRPDDWIRRIGRDFPHYIPVEIDREQGKDGGQSLHFQANGGPAILYSPVWRIDPLACVRVSGFR